MPIDTGLIFMLYRGGSVGPAALNPYPAILGGQPMGTVTDGGGYSNCACGSFAYWMCTRAGLAVPPKSVLGLPKTWVANANPSWIVDTPQAGDVAVRTPTGPNDPGHVTYITDPNWLGGGNLLVEAYDTLQDGTFSVEVRSPSGVHGTTPYTVTFLRFPPTSALRKFLKG